MQFRTARTCPTGALALAMAVGFAASCSKAPDPAPPPAPPAATAPPSATAPPPVTPPAQTGTPPAQTATPPAATPPAVLPPKAPSAPKTAGPKTPAAPQKTQPLPAPRPAAQLLAKNADVVVADMGSPSPVSMTVGQTLGIESEAGPKIWQVDFGPGIFTLLTPADRVSKPGDRGWVWRAAQPGTYDIVLTARMPCPNPPCGENPQRFTVTVQIKPRS